MDDGLLQESRSVDFKKIPLEVEECEELSGSPI